MSNKIKLSTLPKNVKKAIQEKAGSIRQICISFMRPADHAVRFGCDGRWDGGSMSRMVGLGISENVALEECYFCGKVMTWVLVGTVNEIIKLWGIDGVQEFVDNANPGVVADYLEEHHATAKDLAGLLTVLRG